MVVFVQREDVRRFLTHLMASDGRSSRELEMTLRSGHGPLTVRLITRRDSEASDTGVCYHAAIVDLTELRRLDRRRREVEEDRQFSIDAERVARRANEAKDQFIAVVSHELRTPLTPILAAADSLAHDPNLSEQARGKVEIIRRNVRAEARLIDDLLDVARIRQNSLSVERHPLDFHRVVLDALGGWQTALSDETIVLDVKLDAPLHHVDGDASRLGQVFRNLLGNAAKFTPAGGRIEVRTANGDGTLRLEVTDTGTGMNGEEMDRLFEPFRQGARRKGGGLGLGLIISRAIVEAHGGRLELKSAGRGHGTDVIVSLPAIQAPDTEVARQSAAAPERAQPAAAHKRVLLVEDDRDSAEMLSLLLSGDGFDVRVAGSVAAARHLVDGCDVLVSDIGLPDGSGFDLAREATAAGTRAIALSGYGGEQDRRRSREAGFAEHLTKPVDLDQLVEAVRRLAAETPR
jgi:signal transduction histidine kinase